MDYGQQLPEVSAQTATTFTDQTLVAAVTGRTIFVASLFLMTDTAQTVTFESGGTTRIFEAYPAANGGLDLAFYGGQSRFRTNPGESLTVTNDTVGNLFVLVQYWIGDE